MNQLRMRIATGNELGFLVTGGDVESVSAISVIGGVIWVRREINRHR